MYRPVQERVPKYLQIYDYLHGMIKRNKFKVGEKIPTEMSIAEKFGVNRMTARKAFDKLVVEEMVVRRRGQGTFLIAKTPKEFIYSLDITTGFFKDMERYGMKPSSKTVAMEVVEADDRIVQLLDLNGDTRAIYSLRVFYSDGAPIVIEKNYMPYSEFKNLLNSGLSGLRYPVLKEEYNIVPHHSNQTFTAVLPKKNDMKIFGWTQPEACIELEFVAYDVSNVPIEVGYYLYRGDKYRFNINSIEYLVD